MSASATEGGHNKSNSANMEMLGIKFHTRSSSGKSNLLLELIILVID